MSQQPDFHSRYGANNIVIVPTVSFQSTPIQPTPTTTSAHKISAPASTKQNEPSSGIAKVGKVKGQTKPPIEHISKSTTSIKNQLKPIPSKDLLKSKSLVKQLKPASMERKLKSSPEKVSIEDLNKNLANVEDLNKTKKNSWASNYLQSIGHNNIKPIKITLSSARNKTHKIETISTTKCNSNKTVDQPALLEDATTSYEIFNMNDNPFEFSKPNEIKNVNVGNVKTLHPIDLKSDVHPNMVPAFPMSDNLKSTPVTSNIVLDSLYLSNNNNIKTPAYVSLPTKGNEERTHCYNERERKIDILDAIKSKINHESAIKQKSRMMNLPTHKDMCEEFIKEISTNKPASERNRDRSKSSTPAKKNKRVQRNKTKETNSKTLVKKDKESLKTIKKKKSDKERSQKSKSSSLGKDKAVEEKKVDNHKKHRIIKPIVDLKDFDILSKHIFAKKPETPKTEIHSTERQNLKRVHTSSEDQQNSSSEIRTSSPIRSVIQVAENSLGNSPKRQCVGESFDLRSKLSRVNQRMHKKQIENNLNIKPKQQENLKITVENQYDETLKSPKTSSVLKYKTKKCKKLKLIINVVCQESDEESTSSDSSNDETTPTYNMDLSFLDDFNVDEIVDSLKHSPNKDNIKSPLPHYNKKEEIKILADPDMKLATMSNNNNVKSENSKFTTLARPKCEIKETMKAESSQRSNLHKHDPVPDVEMYNICNPEENVKMNSTENINTTKSKLNQQKPASCNESSLDVKYSIQTKKADSCFINTKEEQQNDKTEELILDESVIINEQEISIIDLTNDISGGSETNNNAIAARLNYIPSAEPVRGNKQICKKTNEIKNACVPKNAQKCEKKLSNNRVLNNLKENNHKSATPAFKIDDKTNRHDETIDLTSETIDDEIHKVEVQHKSNMNTQINIAMVNSLKKDINLIPLPNSDKSLLQENKTTLQTKAQINRGEKNCPKDIKFKEKPKEIVVKAISTNNDRISKATETNKTKHDKIIVKDHTAIICKENSMVNSMEKEIHLIPLPNADKSLLKENKTTLQTKTQINRGDKNCPKDIKFKEKPKEIVVNASSTNNDSISKATETNKTKRDKIIVKDDTIIRRETSMVNSMEKEIHLIPLPNADKSLLKENKTTLQTKTQINWGEKNCPKDITFKEKPKEIVVNANSTNNDSISKVTETNKTKQDKIIVKDDTAIICKETSITKIEEKHKESVKNVIEMKEANALTKDNKIMNKIFETKAAKKIIKTIVENVWDTKNEVENTSKTNEINPEPVNASKTNTIGNKDKNEPNLTDQHKALAVLLEERMLSYLHKEIKIIKHIRLGKYSNIFSCKDSNGETYAAKILTNQNDRHIHGIEKEQMIRQLQQDIPRENLNTIYLIDGFGIQRYWCFLTEYYPKNLLQALKVQNKPFHINRVQDLARQLITAVMILRNNNIIHSDIKPTHILLNSTNDRLKLCGFDTAYYDGNVDLLPNIGTSCYRAPEIILGFSASYSIDVWSSALVIYQMATNTQLFPGAYNNDILYKQMCTCGNIPYDMVNASLYKNQHFRGRIFMRRVGFRGQDTLLLQRFNKSKRLQMTLFAAYQLEWAAKDSYERDSDLFKLSALHKLLEQMLLLDPRLRLAIEFVCANPFIYDYY